MTAPVHRTSAAARLSTEKLQSVTYRGADASARDGDDRVRSRRCVRAADRVVMLERIFHEVRAELVAAVEPGATGHGGSP